MDSHYSTFQSLHQQDQSAVTSQRYHEDPYGQHQLAYNQLQQYPYSQQEHHQHHHHPNDQMPNQGYHHQYGEHHQQQLHHQVSSELLVGQQEATGGNSVHLYYSTGHGSQGSPANLYNCGSVGGSGYLGQTLSASIEPPSATYSYRSPPSMMTMNQHQVGTNTNVLIPINHQNGHQHQNDYHHHQIFNVSPPITVPEIDVNVNSSVYYDCDKSSPNSASSTSSSSSSSSSATTSFNHNLYQQQQPQQHTVAIDDHNQHTVAGTAVSSITNANDTIYTNGTNSAGTYMPSINNSHQNCHVVDTLHDHLDPQQQHNPQLQLLDNGQHQLHSMEIAKTSIAPIAYGGTTTTGPTPLYMDYMGSRGSVGLNHSHHPEQHFDERNLILELPQNSQGAINAPVALQDHNMNLNHQHHHHYQDYYANYRLEQQENDFFATSSATNDMITLAASNLGSCHAAATTTAVTTPTAAATAPAVNDNSTTGGGRQIVTLRLEHRTMSISTTCEEISEHLLTTQNHLKPATAASSATLWSEMRRGGGNGSNLLANSNQQQMDNQALNFNHSHHQDNNISGHHQHCSSTLATGSRIIGGSNQEPSSQPTQENTNSSAAKQHICNQSKFREQGRHHQSHLYHRSRSETITTKTKSVMGIAYNHLQTPNNLKSNQCDICGRDYARPSTLKTHLRTHTNERPFRCQICHKTFSQAANLTAHHRIHTGERPFSCPICSRKFSQSSSVITHLRTHSGERPYRCTSCSKTFSDSSTLTKHCRIHSGEKPYQCDHCPLNFSQSGNLSRHLKLHLHNSSNNNGNLKDNNHNNVVANR